MIVVFGSLNVDLLLPIQQMPRPGETHLCKTYHVTPGGKGANQAVAAAKAGSTVMMYGAIGDDDFGRLVRNSLIKQGIDCSGVWVVDAPTGCASICVDPSGENMITVAQGANLEAKASDVNEDFLTENSTVIIQMEVALSENWKILQKAKLHGSRTIVNADPAALIPKEMVDYIDILIMNEMEARFLARQWYFPYLPLEELAPYIAKEHDLIVIITQGDQGSITATPEKSWKVPALPVNIVDTTAAGDAFIGVLAASLDQGYDLEVAVKRASVASSLSCQRRGTQSSMPSLFEIDQALDNFKMSA